MKTLNSIENERDYQSALEAVYELMQTQIMEGSEEEKALLRLSELIEIYEKEHHSIGEQTNPIDAIKFRMEQMNLKSKDVAPIFGGKTRVSEYLNGKRMLTMKIIYNLHTYLDIPYDLLIVKRKSFELKNSDKSKLESLLSL